MHEHEKLLTDPWKPLEDRNSHQEVPPTSCGTLSEAFGIGERLPDVGGAPMGYLEDGDELVIDGWFDSADGGRVGFGPLTSLVKPAMQ